MPQWPEEAAMTRDAKPLILVLDRDSDELTGLYALLDAEGYLVATCLSEIDALKYVSQHKPQLVMISTRGPTAENLSLLESVRRISPATHVVFLSLHGEWSAYLDILEKGGDDLLLKPCKNEEVLAAVRAVVSLAEREKLQSIGLRP